MATLPTTDQLFNDMFYNKKCGLDNQEDHDKFYSWCGGDSGNKEIETVCEIAGSELMRCKTKISFVPKDTKVVPWPQMNKASSPTGIEYSLVCENTINPNKSLDWPAVEHSFPEGYFQMYSKSCYQDVHGFIATLPWWLFILIVLICVAAVSVAAFLFWKYYLKKKLYPTKSTLEAQFTSAPFSTADSSRLPAPKSDSGGRRSRQLGSFRPQGSFTGRQPSRQLSQGRSGSGSNRATSSSPTGSASSLSRKKDYPSLHQVSKTSKRSSLSATGNQYVTKQSMA